MKLLWITDLTKEESCILEKEQIVNLMNIIADTIYIDKFDPDIGTNRIEQRLQRGETIPEAHLRAFQMSKEEVLYNWLKVIKKVIERYFLTLNILVDDDALFQNKFPTTLWQNISRAVKNLREAEFTPMSEERTAISSVFAASALVPGELEIPAGVKLYKEKVPVHMSGYAGG